jgi:hypothetical protein
MAHRSARKISNLATVQVWHFERQMTHVMTSYKPFTFSQVANDHDLSRQGMIALRGQKSAGS